jgi:hypothetical protein
MAYGQRQRATTRGALHVTNLIPPGRGVTNPTVALCRRNQLRPRAAEALVRTWARPSPGAGRPRPRRHPAPASSSPSPSCCPSCCPSSYPWWLLSEREVVGCARESAPLRGEQRSTCFDCRGAQRSTTPTSLFFYQDLWHERRHDCTQQKTQHSRPVFSATPRALRTQSLHAEREREPHGTRRAASRQPQEKKEKERKKRLS